VSVLRSVAFSDRYPAGAVLAGVAAALGGHLLAVGAFLGTARTAYSGEDLEAGGKFTVTVLALLAFAVAEMFIFAVAISVGVTSLRRNQRLGVGILAGWGVGLLVLVAFAVWFLFAATS
jgi:uncharacterized membrane protein YjgN (DUF898 family)